MYGKTLSLVRSYMGSIAMAKRLGGVKGIRANIIYKGDEFEFEINIETGNKKITKHRQSLESLDGEITGAYAIVALENEEPYVEIMTKKQIDTSWGQSPTKGNSPAHKNFASEMAKRTVISKACKLFINTSSDEMLLDDEEFETADHASTQAQHEIAGNANRGEVIDMGEISAAQEMPAQSKSVSNTTAATAEGNSGEIGQQIEMDDPGF